jgi:hypothetical protein
MSIQPVSHATSHTAPPVNEARPAPRDPGRAHESGVAEGAKAKAGETTSAPGRINLTA